MILVCHVFLTRPRDQKGLVILWVRPRQGKLRSFQL